MSDLPEHEHRYETFCADCGAQGWPEAELASLRERLAAAEAERAALSLQLQDARGDYHDERAARVQAEAALSRARELLLAVDIEDPEGNSCLAYDFERAVTCSYQPHAGICWAHRRDAFLADPANTPKETT